MSIDTGSPYYASDADIAKAAGEKDFARQKAVKQALELMDQGEDEMTAIKQALVKNKLDVSRWGGIESMIKLLKQLGITVGESVTAKSVLASVEGLLPEEQVTTLASLKAGDKFRFADGGDDTEYLARGNNWYGSEKGYDGGPWHKDGSTKVIKCEAHEDKRDIEDVYRAVTAAQNYEIEWVQAQNQGDKDREFRAKHASDRYFDDAKRLWAALSPADQKAYLKKYPHTGIQNLK